MSIDSCACYADVISVENIEKIIPDSWNRFFTLCDEHVEGGWEKYIKCLVIEIWCFDKNGHQLDEDNEINKKLEESFFELITKFNESTGLKLEYGYHYPDEGSAYDEISGSYFCVGGCHIKSPEYERLENEFGPVVDRKFYTVFC